MNRRQFLVALGSGITVVALFAALGLWYGRALRDRPTPAEIRWSRREPLSQEDLDSLRKARIERRNQQIQDRQTGR